MTQPGDAWGPSEYPQQDWCQNYPAGQSWQPPYDPWAASQRPLPPPAAPPQFRPPAPPPQPQQHAASVPASRQLGARPRPAATPRRLPPFPAHLVRFPWNALPRSKRSRGPSLGRIFYLGRHPVALLIEACLTAIALEVIFAWIVLVVGAWAMWASAVTVGWLVQVTAAALKR